MQNSNMYFENIQGNHHTVATQKPPNQEVSLGKKLPTSSHIPLTLQQIPNNVLLVFLAQDPESHASFSCPSVSSSFGLKEFLVYFSLLTLMNGRGRGLSLPRIPLWGLGFYQSPSHTHLKAGNQVVIGGPPMCHSSPTSRAPAPHVCPRSSV